MTPVPAIPPHLTTVTPRLVRDPFGHQWMLSRVTEVLSADEIARRGAALS